MYRALLTCVLTLGLSTAAVAQDGKRYAVLAGVNEYQHPKLSALKYAANDAAELGTVLRAAGYTVSLLTDARGKADPQAAPTKANIEARLKAVLGGCKKGDLVLVGFAGHGLQFEGDKDAYFCPSDARPFRENADTLVSLGKVYRELDGSFAGMKVLLVDACRDDPAAGRGVSADASPRPPQGVAAIFSCKAGQRAFEHESLKHGVFFHHVLTGLRGEAADRKGRVTFAGLAAYVGQEVPSDVARLVGNGAVQTPNLKAEYTTEPVLVVSVSAPPPGARTPDDDARTDLRAYEAARDPVNQVQFLKREAPGKIAIWRRAAEAGSAAGQFLLSECYFEGTGVAENEEEAKKWLQKAADGGNGPALVSVGLHYLAVEKDERKAIELFRRASEAGNPAGMAQLGRMYRYGYGVPKDYAAALDLYRKAAAAGEPLATVELGIMHEFGLGVKKDVQQAAAWYRKVADAGSAAAPMGMVSLARLYDSWQDGVLPNHAEAVSWYRKAAEAEDSWGTTAMVELGHKSAAGGKGLPRDDAEAVKWYRKAADLMDYDAPYSLGSMYEHGRGGLARDVTEAAKWYRLAAERNNELGMLSLGDLYAAGGEGLPRDDAEAVKWYRKAADLFNKTAKARLGSMYEFGRGGLPKDDAEALKCYLDAAYGGDGWGMNKVGEFTQTGRGGRQKDEVEAVNWYRKAAAAGEPHGMYNLAFMCQSGRGVAKDEREAAAWYRKAADAGNLQAMISLGSMYAGGQGGLPQDDAEAVKWYRKAADAGEALATYCLGLMTEAGRGGLPKDENAAVEWYKKAALGGSDLAKEALKRLGRN